MESKLFFRVANIETNQGLWYDYDGNYTGLIHNEYNFCTNKDLPMPFDKDLVGWLSATPSLDNLWFWFPKSDIIQLQKHGWYVYIYLANSWKEYKNHYVIEQKTSIPVLRIEISNNETIQTITNTQVRQRAVLNN